MTQHWRDAAERLLEDVDPLELYQWLDRRFLPMDKDQVRRTRSLEAIPEFVWRRGGKFAYGEWAHVIGIFQALLSVYSGGRTIDCVLDVGCGTGLMGLAAAPLLSADGRYVGLDVNKAEIEFCASRYASRKLRFVHLDAHNALYAPGEQISRKPFPFSAGEFDFVTAISVWTHLCEDDARFYFGEVARVLKPGGKAILTAFVLDNPYTRGIAMRTSEPGRYHRLAQDRWVFDLPARGSMDWFSPQWADPPEQAVAFTRGALNQLLQDHGLTEIAHHQGNWKEVPGLYFQDVLVLGKADEG